MKTANCPSCGALVRFQSAASIYAVCDFCRGTLLRDAEGLKNLGRMADLVDDHSLIQIGTEGAFRGKHFRVIGRIQLKYDGGFWNEWHLLFDHSRSAWLSEAGGEYAVSFPIPASGPLPTFEQLHPETQVTIAGANYTVTDRETARCIAGQGELPFRVDPGYAVPSVDLRGNDRFVTIDYSETPPLVFVGYTATFAELKLLHLKDSPGGTPAATVKAKGLNCPHCAAPLTVHSGAITSIGCLSCGSIIGIDNENVRLLASAMQARRVTPWLPLGSKGSLNGVDWEAIGFMQRTTNSGGVDYTWSEYLLFNLTRGFAWLTEYQGHWNFAHALSRPPAVSRGQQAFLYKGSRYRLFSSGKAKVTYVLGEFYWQVAVGEACLVEDYICPPRMLSREVADKEVNWSESDYLEPDALRAAFKITAAPPARVGIFANQPNPMIAGHRRVFRLFWALGLAATCVQVFFFLFLSSQTVLQQSFLLPPAEAEETLATHEFTLPDHVRSLSISHRTDINNNWMEMTTTLIEKETGQAQQGAVAVSDYHGVEDGEAWSEGNREDTIAFRDLAPGTYYLIIEYDLGVENRVSVNDTIEIVRNPLSWSNYLFLLIFLAIFPLISRWRRNAFEAQRWSESDQAGNGGSDDD